VEEARKETPGERINRERGRTEVKEKWSSPKDLCANLENCRDLSVKYKFHINLKP
jgi:hypothetical protein